MELNFFETGDVPQPKESVKIEKVSAMPYPDGWRVRIGVEVTPFQERPSLEINISATDGTPIAQLSVIETMHHSMEFTIHIRGVQNPVARYRLHVELYFDDRANIQDWVETEFSVEKTG